MKNNDDMMLNVNNESEKVNDAAVIKEDVVLTEVSLDKEAAISD